MGTDFIVYTWSKKLRKEGLMKEPMSKEKIDRAIAWYEENVDTISAELPAAISGILYKKDCLAPLSENIESWREGKLALNLADSYVYGPLVKLYRHLQLMQKGKGS